MVVVVGRTGKGASMLGVLIGDGDARARRSAATTFERAGHHVLEASDGGYAIELLKARSFDVVVCDLSLARVDGLTVFRHVRRESPGTAVIVTSASPTVADAVALLKEGAVDFVSKPVDVAALLRGSVGRIVERRALKNAFDEARAWLVGRIVGAALIGDTPAMRQLLERLEGVASSDCTLLISGETGTGKDIVARTVYARGRRAARPFVAIDCKRGTAVEAALFGADGELAAASDGTIFLDEVGELCDSAQAKLAHVLARLQASQAPAPRVIAATHHDLRALVADGHFREDLYFLLRTVDLVVPPLRERKADLPLLVRHFLERLTPRGLVPPGVGARAWGALEAYDFPGNVRELARAIEHALALAHGSEIEREHLPLEIGRESLDPAAEIAPLAVVRRQFERDYARRAVSLCDGDVERAAQLLGVGSDALARKLGGRPSEAPPAPLQGRDPAGSHAPGPVKTGARISGRVRAAAPYDPLDLHDPETQEVPAQSHAKLRARGER